MNAVAKYKLELSGISGNDTLRFIDEHADLARGKTEVVKTTERFNIEKLAPGTKNLLINLHRVNDIGDLNGFFRAANKTLPKGGTLIGCCETLEQRKDRLKKKYPPILNRGYYALDFIFKRIFPKFELTRRFYLWLTNGRNRALSKSEVLGRLVYCGFKVSGVRDIENKLFFAVTKAGPPLEEPPPSLGMILKIKRAGHHGKPITVYKFRTMHPYAQYLQAYVFEQNNLREGGKFENDFRITKWGRWMRKCWIDELPMIWNILRGDLKIVGVRPLSEHYLSLYTSEHRETRLMGKPGLIPPFYADLPRDLREIMDSEARYIEAYLQDPLRTDLSYCWKVIQNIVLRGARSH